MRNVQLLLASLVATGTTLLTTSALTLAQEPPAVDEPITLFGVAYVGFHRGHRVQRSGRLQHHPAPSPESVDRSARAPEITPGAWAGHQAALSAAWQASPTFGARGSVVSSTKASRLMKSGGPSRP